MIKFPKLLMIALLTIMVLTACQEQPAGTMPGYDKAGNPKLSSQLNDLVRADKSGEAASLAQQNNIELVDNRVRVIVEVLPGQMEAATRAANNLGTVETSYGDLLQVLIPVSSLEVLANEPDVRLIRLPVPAVPAARDSQVK